MQRKDVVQVSNPHSCTPHKQTCTYAEEYTGQHELSLIQHNHVFNNAIGMAL